MARIKKRKAQLAEPPVPVDPNGMVAWKKRFLSWMHMRGYAPLTVVNRDIGLTKFIAWCAARSLYRPEEITKPILERYRSHLFHRRNPKTGKPWSFQTQQLMLTAVKMYFRWLTKSNVLLWNPASELELPRVTHRAARQVLNIEEVETVLNQPDTREPMGLRDRAIMEVLYSTGMRRVELAALQIYDYDRQRSTMLVRKGKGGSSRVLPLGERASLWLQKYLDEARPELALEPDDGTLFINHFGEAFGVGYLSTLVGRHVRAAKLGKRGSCHLFRHTAATLMLEHGADIRFIQHSWVTRT